MLPTGASTSDRTRVDTAARILRERILGGVIAPGARLMISPVAKELDMSIIPVREAVKRLESEGLVDHVPHKGARVRPISTKDLVDLYQLRIELESYAVREAAVRITPDDEAHLMAILEAYRIAYQQD